MDEVSRKRDFARLSGVVALGVEGEDRALASLEGIDRDCCFCGSRGHALMRR
jgi:hypothetical protein